MYPTQPQNMTRKNLDFYLHLNVNRYNAEQTLDILFLAWLQTLIVSMIFSATRLNFEIEAAAQ